VSPLPDKLEPGQDVCLNYLAINALIERSRELQDELEANRAELERHKRTFHGGGGESGVARWGDETLT